MSQSAGRDDPNSVRAEVQTWLMGEGWKLSESHVPEAHWVIQAEDKAGRKILVGQAKSPEDQIRIVGVVLVDPKHKTQFEALRPEIRRRILWELRFLLLSMNIEFNGVGEPLQRIEVSQRIYIEGLTKDSFLQRFSLTKNALIAVLWSLARELESVSPPTGQSDAFLH